jgi:hypothetical protein
VGSLRLAAASATLLLPDADSGTGTTALSSMRALSKRCPLFLAEQRTAVAYRSGPALLSTVCMHVEREKEGKKNRV